MSVPRTPSNPVLPEVEKVPVRVDNPTTGRRGSKINNIQALRAFAAIAVVSFHTGYIWPNLHGVGSFGVEVFS